MLPPMKMASTVDDDDDVHEALLKKLYYDPKSPCSFGGVDSIFREAKRTKNLTNVTRKKVQEFLRAQKTYTKHAWVRKNFCRNPIWAYGLNDVWFADLHSIENLQYQNRRKKFLFIVIDAFSHFIYCQPLKNKAGPTVLKGFKEIVARAAATPSKFVTDSGTEFINRAFQQYLTENDVQFIPTRPPLKASMAEQAGKLLKRKIWRFMTANKTKKFIDYLQDFVDSLNARKLKSLNGIAPKDVKPENQMEIYEKRYGKYRNKKNTNFKFPLGSYVCLAKKWEAFTKGFWPGYSDEIYVIDGHVPHYPREKYRLTDLLGNRISGTYYAEELTAVLNPDTQV